MARSRRSYRPKRRDANYVWQSILYGGLLTVDAGAANRTVNFQLNAVIPGVGFDTTVKPFMNEHTLERVVGAMAHNGQGGTASSSDTDWFPFAIGAVKVPEGLNLSSDGINLFDANEADDYLFRMDTVCNEASNQDAVPNWHEVNAKTRRKFDVGDSIQFVASAHVIPALTRPFTVDLSMNLRFLWRLKD